MGGRREAQVRPKRRCALQREKKKCQRAEVLGSRKKRQAWRPNVDSERGGNEGAGFRAPDGGVTEKEKTIQLVCQYEKNGGVPWQSQREDRRRGIGKERREEVFD